MREGKSFGEEEIGDLEGKRVGLAWAERGEMGEVGGDSEADLEGQGKVGGRVDGLGDPVFFRSHEEGGEIEEVGFGRSEFKIGDEGINEGESFGLRGFFGGGIRVEKEEVGAAGEAAGGAEPGMDSELSGGEVDCSEVGFFSLAGREEGGRLVGRGAVACEEATEGKVPEMESGVVHAFPASFWLSGL